MSKQLTAQEAGVSTSERAVWTTAYINNLADSCFLYIESGGTKDSTGKTTPRSLRHFPYKDSGGNVDLPHLRNALSRIPQSTLPSQIKSMLTTKAQKIMQSQGRDAQNSAPPRENLVRALGEAPTLTRDTADDMPTLHGHFAVWDTWTEIRSAFEGNFMERFAPGALNKTLAENTPKVLFQHGKDPQIGDKVLGIPSRVAPDAHGAAYDVPLFDTTYNHDLIPGLDAGAYGSSFRFSVMQENVNKKPGKSDYNPRGIPERTVTEARVAEFGPVTFPAYANATAGLRSLTDEFLLDRLLADEQLAERVAERVNDKQRVSVYFGSAATPTMVVGNGAIRSDLPKEPERLDAEDLSTLACMLQSGTQYIADQDDADDQANITKMEAILADIAALVPIEVAEDEPPEPDDEGTYSEPAPTGTTRAPDTEPEPTAATTRSRTSLFWFVDDPKLKGAK